MEIRTTYVALDGTEFEEEEACRAHEATLIQENEYVKLYDRDGNLIEWNPDSYDRMWNKLYFIVIAPNFEEDVENWWENTFESMLSVNPFEEMENDWKAWKCHYHGDEPTVLAYDFAGNDSWIIFNEIYDEVKGIVRGLGLVDALS